MPVVYIEYDNKKITDNDIQKLSEGIHEIVSSVTSIEDVPVYTNNSQIKVAISPIEIFIQMSAYKIKDADVLIVELKKALSSWKAKENYTHRINMTLIPMNWKVEVDI